MSIACLLSQLPTPSTRVAHHGVVVPSIVWSSVQLLYSFPSMKKGNWHGRPSVVVQFVHGVSGVVVGLAGLGLLLVFEDPEDAEHGCNKSPEAMSAQLDCQIQQLTIHTIHKKQDRSCFGFTYFGILWSQAFPQRWSPLCWEASQLHSTVCRRQT